jgi:hypothetical protein
VLDHEDKESLEDEWKDLGFEFTDLNTLFTQLAFIGVRKEVESAAHKDIMRDLDLFRGALNEREKTLDHDDQDDELENDIYELEEAIQELEEYE